MHKILIFGFLLFLIPASGQAFETGEKKFYGNVIRSQGWKCDEVRSALSGDTQSGYSLAKSVEVECRNGKVYYVVMNIKLKSGERSISVCHKSKCKKVN